MKLSVAGAAVALAFAAGRYEARSSDLDSPLAAAAPAPAAVRFEQDQDEAKKMMEKWMAVCRPSDAHKYLAPFVGKWDWTMKMMSPGGAQETKGTAEYRWLVEGKWLIRESVGKVAFLPQTIRSFTIFGYDNFKKKYVSVQVDSFTTAMLYSEGMLDRSGKDRVSYGPMDEPMTDEHDKPVKYATRVKSADEHVEEVHDLAMSETQSMVIETVYKRAK